MNNYNELFDRVEITNLFGWAISFKSPITRQDIYIEQYARNLKILTVQEVQTQIIEGNIAFCGVDGCGSHAAFLIEDPEMRKFLFKTDVEPVQFTMERLNKVLAAKTRDTFKHGLDELIVTTSEAREAQKRLDSIGLDDLVAWKRDIFANHCKFILAGGQKDSQSDATSQFR